jgi:hypothetical protein
MTKLLKHEAVQRFCSLERAGRPRSTMLSMLEALVAFCVSIPIFIWMIWYPIPRENTSRVVSRSVKQSVKQLVKQYTGTMHIQRFCRLEESRHQPAKLPRNRRWGSIDGSHETLMDRQRVNQSVRLTLTLLPFQFVIKGK